MAKGLPKVANYVKNVGKSLAFAAIDSVSENIEGVKDFAEANDEIFKEVYAGARNYRETMKKAHKAISDNKSFAAVKLGLKNMRDDLKSGNFYNSRDYSDEIMGLDDDSDDFSFTISEGGDDESSGSNEYATATKELANSFDQAIGGAADMQCKTIVNGVEIVTKSNEASTKAIMSSIEGSSARISSGIGAVYTEVSNITKFMNTAMVSHMENSRRFYEEQLRQTNELVAMQKELLEMQRNLYIQKQERKDSTFDDAFTASGGMNIKGYGKAIKKNFQNILDQTGLGMIGGSGMNPLMMWAASPWQPILSAVFSMATPKDFKGALKSLDTSLTSLFSNMIAQANMMAKEEDGSLMGFLGKLFGIELKTKDKINTGNYKKEAVPFDGITRQSIIETIPGYLARIEAALTGGGERFYDFQTGSWKSARSVREEHDKRSAMSVASAGYDLRSAMEPLIAEFAKVSEANAEDFKKQLAALNKQVYADGGAFSPKRHSASYYGMSDEYMKAMLDHAKKDPRARAAINGLASSHMRAQQSQNRYMNAIESSGAIERVLYNGTFEDGKVPKGMASMGSGMLALSKDADGHNVFYYLKEILTHLRNRPAGSSRPKGKAQRRREKRSRREGGGSSSSGSSSDDGGDGGSDPDSDFIDPVMLSDEELMEAVRKNREEEEAKRNPSKKFGDKIRDKFGSTKAGQFLGGLADKFGGLVSAPMDYMTKLLNKADQNLFKMFFGAEDGKKYYDKDGNEIDSVFNYMIVKVKETFENLGKWIKDKFDPIKDKLKEKLKPLWDKYGAPVKNAVGDMFRSGKNRAKLGLQRTFGRGFDNVTQAYQEGSRESKYDKFAKTVESAGVATFDEALQMAKEQGVTAATRFYYEASKDNPEARKKIVAVGKQARTDVSRLTKKLEETAVKKANREKVISDLEKGGVKTAEEIKDETSEQPKTSAYGRYVTKRGLTMISPGEIIIPASTDPKELAKMERLERRDRAKISNYIGLNAQGTVDTEAMKNNLHKIYEENKDPSKASRVGAGGILGAGAGLLMGNPLLGALAGAGLSILQNSDTLKNMLFGEKGEDGERKGGVVPKSVQDFFKKNGKDMGDFGIAGGLLGLMTPFGILGGAAIGAGIGYLKNNDNFKKFVFGDAETGKDGLISKESAEKAKKFFKKSIPAMGIGAVAGMLMGPFGLLGNAVLGAGAGLLTSTSAFHKFIFGDPDNPKKGSLVGAIKNGILNPAKERIHKIFDDLKEWGKKTILAPLKNFGKELGIAIKNAVTNTFGKVKDFLNNMFEKTIGIPIHDFLQEKIFKPITKTFFNILKAPLAIGKAIVGAPFKAMGAAADHMQKKRVKTGQAGEMTAAERLKFRDDKKMGKRDKYYQQDTALAGMDESQLESLNKLVGGRMKAREEVGKRLGGVRQQMGQEISSFFNSTDASGVQMYDKVGYNKVKKIAKMAAEGDEEGAFAAIDNLKGLNDEEKKRLKTQISALLKKTYDTNKEFRDATDELAKGDKELEKMLGHKIKGPADLRQIKKAAEDEQKARLKRASKDTKEGKEPEPSTDPAEATNMFKDLYAEKTQTIIEKIAESNELLKAILNPNKAAEDAKKKPSGNSAEDDKSDDANSDAKKDIGDTAKDKKKQDDEEKAEEAGVDGDPEKYAKLPLRERLKQKVKGLLNTPVGSKIKGMLPAATLGVKGLLPAPGETTVVDPETGEVIQAPKQGVADKIKAKANEVTEGVKSKMAAGAGWVKGKGQAAKAGVLSLAAGTKAKAGELADGIKTKTGAFKTSIKDTADAAKARLAAEAEGFKEWRADKKEDFAEWRKNASEYVKGGYKEDIDYLKEAAKDKYADLTEKLHLEKFNAKMAAGAGWVKGKGQAAKAGVLSLAAGTKAKAGELADGIKTKTQPYVDATRSKVAAGAGWVKGKTDPLVGKARAGIGKGTSFIKAQAGKIGEKFRKEDEPEKRIRVDDVVFLNGMLALAQADGYSSLDELSDSEYNSYYHKYLNDKFPKQPGLAQRIKASTSNAIEKAKSFKLPKPNFKKELVTATNAETIPMGKKGNSEEEAFQKSIMKYAKKDGYKNFEDIPDDLVHQYYQQAQADKAKPSTLDTIKSKMTGMTGKGVGAVKGLFGKFKKNKNKPEDPAVSAIEQVHGDDSVEAVEAKQEAAEDEQQEDENNENHAKTAGFLSKIHDKLFGGEKGKEKKEGGILSKIGQGIGGLFSFFGGSGVGKALGIGAAVLGGVTFLGMFGDTIIPKIKSIFFGEEGVKGDGLFGKLGTWLEEKFPGGIGGIIERGVTWICNNFKTVSEKVITPIITVLLKNLPTIFGALAKAIGDAVKAAIFNKDIGDRASSSEYDVKSSGISGTLGATERTNTVTFSQAKDEAGNPLYYTDETESNITTEVTEYPVMQVDQGYTQMNTTDSVLSKVGKASGQAFVRSAAGVGKSGIGKMMAKVSGKGIGKGVIKTATGGVGKIVKGAGATVKGSQAAGNLLHNVADVSTAAKQYANELAKISGGSADDIYKKIAAGGFTTQALEDVGLDVATGLGDEAAEKALQVTINASDNLAASGSAKAMAKAAEGATKNVAANAADDIAKGGIKGIKTAVKNMAKNTGDNLGSKIAQGFTKIFSQIANSKIGSKILSFCSAGTTKAMLDAALEKIGKKLGEKVMKGVVGKSITKIASAIGGKSPLAIAFWIKDFLHGFSNADTILGVAKGDTEFEVNIGHKIVCGLLELLTNQFTFGLLPSEIIVDICIEFLFPLLGLDVESLKAARERSQAIMDEWNLAHPEETYDNLEDFNNKDKLSFKLKKAIGNTSVGEQIGNVKQVGGGAIQMFKDAGSTIKNVFSGIKNGNLSETMAPLLESVKGFPKWIGAAFLNLWTSAVTGEDSEASKIADDDPMKGLKNVILGIMKVVTCPITSIVKFFANFKENMSKIGEGLKSFGKNIWKGVKDVAAKTWEGDLFGAFAVKAKEEDDRGLVGTLSSAVFMVMKISASPLILIASMIGKIKETVIKAIEIGKIIVPTLATAVGQLFVKAWEGEDYNIRIATTGNSMMDGVMNTMFFITKVVTAPLRMITWAVSRIVEAVKVVIEAGKLMVPRLFTAVGKLFTAAWKGEEGPDKPESTGNNVMDIINNVVFFVAKIALTVPRVLTWTVGRIVDTVKVVIEAGKLMIPRLTTAIGKLFTAAWKGEEGPDKPESTGNNVMDIINNVVFFVAKIGLTVPRVLTWAIGRVVESVKVAVNAGKKMLPNLTTAVGKLFTAAWKGEEAPSEPASTGNNAMDIINKVIFSVIKVVTTPVRIITGIIGTIVSFFTEGINGLKKRLQPVTDAFNWIKEKVGGIFESITGFFENTFGKIKSFFGGGNWGLPDVGGWISDKFGAVVDGIKNAASAVGEGISNAWNTVKGWFGGAGQHLYQSDPNLANKKYGPTTIGENGCAPVAATNAINNIRANSINLNEAAQHAERNGFLNKEGATDMKYFESIFNKYGIKTQFTNDSNLIMEALKRGHQVVMLGMDAQGNSNSPYGSRPHFITGVGLDRNKNIIIEDPDMPQARVAYDPRRVFSTTASALVTSESIGTSQSGSGRSDNALTVERQHNANKYGSNPRALDSYSTSETPVRVESHGGANKSGGVSYETFLETIVTILMSIASNTGLLAKILEILSERLDLNIDKKEVQDIIQKNNAGTKAALARIIQGSGNADAFKMLGNKDTDFVLSTMRKIASE